jgi:hypothetical protein
MQARYKLTGMLITFLLQFNEVFMTPRYLSKGSSGNCTDFEYNY